MNPQFFKKLLSEWRMDSIGVAVFVALTGLAYVLQFEPAMRDREALRLGTETLADKREQIGKLQSTMHNMNGQIASLQTALDSELKLLPPSQINDRLSSVSTLAADHGLIVEAIEPGETSSAQRFSTIPIRITGRGTYPQLAKFIHALRSELPDISVTDISISGGGTGVAATVSLNLLWYAGPAPVVAKTDMQ